MLNCEDIQPVPGGVPCNRSRPGPRSDALFFLHLLVNTNEGSRASLLTSSNVALSVYYQVCNLTSEGTPTTDLGAALGYKLTGPITTRSIREEYIKVSILKRGTYSVHRLILLSLSNTTHVEF